MPIVPTLENTAPSNEGMHLLQPHEQLATLLTSRSVGNPGTATSGYVDANGETISVG